MEWNFAFVIVNPELHLLSIDVRGRHGIFHEVHEVVEIFRSFAEVDEEYYVRLVGL